MKSPIALLVILYDVFYSLHVLISADYYGSYIVYIGHYQLLSIPMSYDHVFALKFIISRSIA